jgi:hypothetical protein
MLASSLHIPFAVYTTIFILRLCGYVRSTARTRPMASYMRVRLLGRGRGQQRFLKNFACTRRSEALGAPYRAQVRSGDARVW